MYDLDSLFSKSVPIQRNQAMGIYTADSQLNFDDNMLLNLGFTQAQINTLKYIIENNGKVSVNNLVSYGLTYTEAQKLRYMYDIVTGRVTVSTKEELIKHLRKMFGTGKRISISDLAISTVSNVPRMAVVANIKDPKFKIFNSSEPGFSPRDRVYKVTNVSGSRITVMTTRRPVLKYKESRKIEGVLEIKQILDDQWLEVAFDKKYCRLCNRFIIVASIRKPERHHGLIEIICIEGTRVYVYAQSLGTKEQVNYNGGTQRVYDYGLFASEIKDKLFRAATMLYQRVCGVTAFEEDATEDFKVILPEKRDTLETEYDEL